MTIWLSNDYPWCFVTRLRYHPLPSATIRDASWQPRDRWPLMPCTAAMACRRTVDHSHFDARKHGTGRGALIRCRCSKTLWRAIPKWMFDDFCRSWRLESCWILNKHEETRSGLMDSWRFQKSNMNRSIAHWSRKARLPSLHMLFCYVLLILLNLLTTPKKASKPYSCRQDPIDSCCSKLYPLDV